MSHPELLWVGRAPTAPKLSRKGALTSRACRSFWKGKQEGLFGGKG